MDTYFDTRVAVNRLYAEWQKHPKLIIACDFDDTVYDTHEKGHTFSEVIDLLRESKKLGFYVVIFTASKVERYPLIREHMKSLDIEIDGINENVIELPFGKNGKIYANIFLDDRAGLYQAAFTLRSLITKIQDEQKK